MMCEILIRVGVKRDKDTQKIHMDYLCCLIREVISLTQNKQLLCMRFAPERISKESVFFMFLVLVTAFFFMSPLLTLPVQLMFGRFGQVVEKKKSITLQDISAVRNLSYLISSASHLISSRWISSSLIFLSRLLSGGAQAAVQYAGL